MSPKTNPKRAKYLAHIERQKESGLSVKKYCLEHDLSDKQFIYYKSYKLRSSTPKRFAALKVKQVTGPKAASRNNVYRVDPAWLAELIHNLLEPR